MSLCFARAQIRALRSGSLAAASLVLGAALFGCSSPPKVAASRIAEERVIGVQLKPAEGKPGETLKAKALIASTEGFVKKVTMEWAMCVRPRSPADPITVSPFCFDDAMDMPKVLMPGAAGPAVIKLKSKAINARVKIPFDACQRVGPQVPLMTADGKKQRPPDADITGGYQIPVRTTLKNDDGEDVTFVRVRLRCALASAPAASAREFEKRYVANENPSISAILVDGKEIPLDRSVVPKVKRGDAVPVEVKWHSGTQEKYVLLDPKTRNVVERTEGLEIAWYTDGGEFDFDRTTPEKGRRSENTLLLDHSRKKKTQVWVTLRDERGGVGFATFEVQPE
jgi:hypothetical protein